MPLKRILYAEDEIHIQTVAKLALERIGGFDVKACSSGQEALACAEVFVPDLILLDVMMPGLDGPSTLQQLRQMPQFFGTPVVFMTAKVQHDEVEHYKSLGVVEVIAKPFNSVKLSNQLRAVWERFYG